MPGRAPSGYEGSSFLPRTGRASGRTTATTTTATPGRNSATASAFRPQVTGFKHQALGFAASGLSWCGGSILVRHRPPGFSDQALTFTCLTGQARRERIEASTVHRGLALSTLADARFLIPDSYPVAVA